MIVDDDLVGVAQALLERRFGDHAGAATAVYTLEGNCYSSVSLTVTNPSSCVAPEVGAMCEAYKNGERISAVVTVQRRVDGGPVLYATPSGATIDQLVLTSAREAEIVVHNLAEEDKYWIRPVRSLGVAHVSQMKMEGNFDAGMRQIRGELRDLARVQAMPTTRTQWAPCLRSAFENELVHRYAAVQGKPRHPAEFAHPNGLASRRLRHIWHGFEAASHAFFEAIVDHHEHSLRGIGCNDSDMLHIRQGAESLRAVFGNVLIWVESRRPVHNELPFLPYFTSKLSDGLPMHEYFGPGSAAAALEDPVAELIRLLVATGEDGLAGYLRQRRLFHVEAFVDGTRRCPFDSVSLELYRATGHEIAAALADGVLLDDVEAPAP
ncbi:MAG: hypothetical protein ACE367_01540 [Acidimicrobiales bacterium]